jgi:hypothetical protein
MTEFNGVKRVTRGAYSVLYVKERRIVVSLAQGDLITFKEHARRQTWSLPADTAFRYAVRLAAFADLARKRSRKAKHD